MEICICLPLFLFRLNAIRNICKNWEVFKVIGEISQLVTYFLEISMIQTQTRISFRFLKVHYTCGVSWCGVLLYVIFRPLLAVYQRIINNLMFLHINQVIFDQSLNIWIINVLYWSIYSLLRYVTAYKLYINIMLLFHLLEIVQVTFEFFIFIFLMNWPILKR